MCLIVFFGVRLVDLWAYIPRILGRRLTQVGEAENYSFQRKAPVHGQMDNSSIIISLDIFFSSV